MNLFQDVRDSNRKKYGTEAERTMQIIINQYSDRTHFIYEILQNAEDAGATKIGFYLHRDRLEIKHNGRPFDEKDINGVCGVADGTKGDGTRIGHFGIGFKSVYAYTEHPEIYSGEYSFRINNYLFPEEIPSRELLESETCMILSFDKANVSPTTAYAEIKEALTKKINAESIIILDKIADIIVDIDGEPTVISLNKEKGRVKATCDKVYDINILTSTQNRQTGRESEKEVNYLYFTDGGAPSEAVAIVFLVDGNEIQKIPYSKLYAFFPTAKPSFQNFYIHAPFDTTPARDNIKEGAEFGRRNVALIEKICKLINFALEWMRDNGYLSFVSFSRALPIYDYSELDMLRPIYENSVELIESGDEILPTNVPMVFKGLPDICIPENMRIATDFNDQDLQQLIGEEKYWLAKEITTNAYLELREFLDENFEIRTVEWKPLITKLTACFLEKKEFSWIERLIKDIHNFCVYESRGNSDFISVKNIPFVRLTTGRHICSKEDGKPLVYLNNPDCCKNKIHSSYLNSEIVRNFLSTALHVQDYNIESDTVDNILPKYATADVKFQTADKLEENLEDLRQIKKALIANPGLVEKVENSYVVTDGRQWYRPIETHIPSESTSAGYELLQSTKDLVFISDDYSKKSATLDEAFFQKIGCSLGLRTLEVESRQYLDIVQQYQGRKSADELRYKVFSKNYLRANFRWNLDYEGFDSLFSDMNEVKSKKIARFLSSHLTEFDIDGDLSGANDQRFSGSSVESVAAYSAIGLRLTFEKWIYVDGKSEPQRPIDVDRENIRFEDYGQYKKLMAKLPFKEVSSVFTEFLEETYKNPSEREQVKRLLSDPDQLLNLAKAKANNDARQAAQDEKRSKDIRSLMEKNDKRQAAGNNSDGTYFPPISVGAKEKREKNLDEILKASLNDDNKIVSGLSFVKHECNKEEKEFLKAEYDGACQICDYRMVDYKGEPYFEAINVIKGKEMDGHFSHSLELGWDSLCLCPNCAAKYNYCSKKISGMYDQVMNSEVIPNDDSPIEIQIELPEGEPHTIRYSPRHFMALKEALKIYTQD